MPTVQERLNDRLLFKLSQAKKAEQPTLKQEDLFVDGVKSTLDVSHTADTVPYSELLADYGGGDFIVQSGRPDFGVPVNNTADYQPNDRLHIPALHRFEGYIVQHEYFYTLCRAYAQNLRMMTYGDSGTGKTTAIELLAALTNSPFIRFQGRQDLDSETFIGRPSGFDEKQQLTWDWGEFSTKLRDGYIILIDEPFKIPPGIMMTIQRVLEDDGVLFVENAPGNTLDKTIAPHPNTRIFLADNVSGTGDDSDLYSATINQDASMLNRIAIVKRLDYLPTEEERKRILSKHPEVPEEVARRLAQFASLMQSSFRERKVSAAFSPRTMDAWLQGAAFYRDYKLAFDDAYRDRISDPDELVYIDRVFESVFTGIL